MKINLIDKKRVKMIPSWITVKIDTQYYNIDYSEFVIPFSVRN